MFQFLIEQFGSPTDLGTADLVSTEFLGDGGDVAGGDALDVHLGQGVFQRPFAAFSAFDGLGVEGDATGLRDVEGHCPEPGSDGLGLEAVGIAPMAFGPFLRLGLESVGTFEFHGFVEQHATGVGHSVEPMLGEEFQNVVKDGRMFLVGHAVLLRLSDVNHKETGMAPFSRWSPW